MDTQITNVVQAFKTDKQYAIPSYQRTAMASYLFVPVLLTGFVDPVPAV